MEINDNSVKGGEYYDNVYDVYLKESGQYNIYIENDLDANKDDEYYENLYELYQNDSSHYDIYLENTFDSSLCHQVLRDGVTDITKKYTENSDDLYQRQLNIIRKPLKEANWG